MFMGEKCLWSDVIFRRKLVFRWDVFFCGIVVFVEILIMGLVFGLYVECLKVLGKGSFGKKILEVERFKCLYVWLFLKWIFWD